jgi:sec-independent protein translocase protein TatC
VAVAPFPVPRRPDDDDHSIRLTDPDDTLDDGSRMSFLEHLDELRKRLIHCAAALIVGVFVAFFFLDQFFNFVFVPLKATLPPGGAFITTEAPEYFMLYLKVGLLSGFFVALPYIVFQLWLFIAPGLYSHEKRFAIPFVAFASVFFIAGAAFAHYVAFPVTWQFFIDFSKGGFVQVMPQIGPTFALYVRVVLGFGAIFQMPTVVFFLARMGIVNAMFLIKNTKYAILIIFILAAVLSPGGDLASQFLMAGPMLVLYVLSILIAFVFAKRKKPVEIND